MGSHRLVRYGGALQAVDDVAAVLEARRLAYRLLGLDAHLVPVGVRGRLGLLIQSLLPAPSDTINL